MNCELLLPYIPVKKNFDVDIKISPEKYISMLNTDYHETAKEIENCLDNNYSFNNRYDHHKIKVYDTQRTSNEKLEYNLSPFNITLNNINDEKTGVGYLKHMSIIKEMSIFIVNINDNIFSEEFVSNDFTIGVEELQYWVRDSLNILYNEEYLKNNEILLKLLPERDIKIRFFEIDEKNETKIIKNEFVFEKCKIIEVYNDTKYALLINKIKQTS